MLITSSKIEEIIVTARNASKTRLVLRYGQNNNGKIKPIAYKSRYLNNILLTISNYQP